MRTLRSCGAAARVSCALVLNVLAAAAGGEAPGDYAQILKRTSAVQCDALAEQPATDLVPPLRDEDLAFGRHLLDQATSSAGAALHAADAPAPEQTSVRIVYFVSFSIPGAELLAILQEAAAHREARVVFQGVRPGQMIGAFARELRTLAEGNDPLPEAGIDPPLFRQYNVRAVPEVLLEADGHVYRARGSIGVDELRARVAQSPEITDLGRFGPTYDIVEPDLITVMQARLAALDVATLKRRAVESYWRAAQFVDLPKARQDAERTVSTRVEVTHDISAPDGTPIARAGEVINLGEIVPLSKWYVVFDATDDAQRAFAREWIARADAAGRGVSLITTRLDRERGWDGLNALDEELGLPVYLLRADLVDRFDIRAMPSVLRSDAGRLVVQEYELD